MKAPCTATAHGSTLAALCMTMALLPWAQSASGKPLEVACDRTTHRVTLHAEAEPIGTVLGALASACGIEVRLDPAVSRPVTAHIESLPLGEALDRVSGRLNLIRQYKDKRLAAVIVLPAGSADMSRALPVVPPAEKARANPEKRVANVEKRAARQAERKEQRIKQLQERTEQRIAAMPQAERKQEQERLERKIERLRAKGEKDEKDAR